MGTAEGQLEAIKNVFLTQKKGENFLELIIQVLRVIRTDIITQYGNVVLDYPDEIANNIEEVQAAVERGRRFYDLALSVFELNES